MALDKATAYVVRSILVGDNEGSVSGVGYLAVRRAGVLAVRWAAGSSACVGSHVVDLSAVSDENC